MEESTPTLIRHMELLFGEIVGGFLVPPDITATPGVQYVEWKGGTVENVTVTSTLGLSSFELRSSGNNKSIHQELFLMFRDGEAHKKIPAVLHQIVSERLQGRIAISRGQVLKKEGLVIPNTNFTALYATVPIYYPNEMWVCQTNGANIMLCWLLPITDREWRLVSQKGWPEFEILLDQAEVDLFDLQRPSLV